MHKYGRFYGKFLGFSRLTQKSFGIFLFSVNIMQIYFNRTIINKYYIGNENDNDFIMIH